MYQGGQLSRKYYQGGQVTRRIKYHGGSSITEDQVSRRIKYQGGQVSRRIKYQGYRVCCAICGHGSSSENSQKELFSIIVDFRHSHFDTRHSNFDTRHLHFNT